MGEISLWYDHDVLNNCCYNTATYSERTITDQLDLFNINYDIKNTKETLLSNNLNIYVIELNNVYVEYDIFSLIPDRTKNLLKNGLKLLLYYPREGHQLESWFLRIYHNLLRNDIIDSDIFFLFGDYDIEKNYNKFIKDHDIPSFLKPLYIDYFLGDYYNRAKETNDSLELNRKYDFLFYNGKIRPHRLLAVAELDRRNLIKNNLVSLTATTHTGEAYSLEDCMNILEPTGLCSDHLRNFVANFNPLILDIDSDQFSQENINNTNLNHYSNSYFSIVSETCISTKFITEKTYKPIYNLHPFIIMGSDGILDILKKQGFYTFEELFDESYDQETNLIVRFKKIIDEIDNFTKLSKLEKSRKIESVKEKLIHNKNHFVHLASSKAKLDFENIFSFMKG